MTELFAILKTLSSLRPLETVELEAADIVSGVTSLFKAVSTASPAAMNMAMITLTKMEAELEEDVEAEEQDLSDEGQRLRLVLIKMVQTTRDHMKSAVAAHVGLDCDGDCPNCEKKKDKPEAPGECYTPGDKKPWS